MEKIKAVIYDLDGVLIDSRRANEAFYNQILRRFGRPDITPEQLTRAQFLTSLEAVTLLFAGTPWLDAALAYQKTVDNEPLLPLISVEPGVKEVLGRLRPTHRLAIATNRGRSLPLVLERLGLAEFFEMVISSLNITHPKPHPECLQVILRHFGLEPREGLYVGDAEVDRQVAARAGVPFAAYKNPRLAAAYHLPDHWSLLEILEPKTKN
jgi:phosphoglycolate phosphatase